MTKSEFNRKVAYFKQYRELCRECERLKLIYKQIKIDSMTVSLHMADMPKSSKKRDLSDVIVKLDEYEQMILAKVDEKISKLKEINSIIESFDNQYIKDFFTYRYIAGLTVDKIEKIMLYNRGSLYRFHTLGLEQVAV